MAKWADYLISAVGYKKTDGGSRFINKVKVHEDTGDKAPVLGTWTRAKVLEKLDEKYSFKTIYRGEDKEGKKVWMLGDLIEKYSINNNTYIKTKGDSIEEDNLGELPELPEE